MGDDGPAPLPQRQRQGISIHVPRMGDDEEVSSQIDDLAISIHVPRMGDDLARASRSAR